MPGPSGDQAQQPSEAARDESPAEHGESDQDAEDDDDEPDESDEEEEAATLDMDKPDEPDVGPDAGGPAAESDGDSAGDEDAGVDERGPAASDREAGAEAGREQMQEKGFTDSEGAASDAEAAAEESREEDAVPEEAERDKSRPAANPGNCDAEPLAGSETDVADMEAAASKQDAARQESDAVEEGAGDVQGPDKGPGKSSAIGRAKSSDGRDASSPAEEEDTSPGSSEVQRACAETVRSPEKFLLQGRRCAGTSEEDQSEGAAGPGSPAGRGRRFKKSSWKVKHSGWQLPKPRRRPRMNTPASGNESFEGFEAGSCAEPDSSIDAPAEPRQSSFLRLPRRRLRLFRDRGQTPDSALADSPAEAVKAAARPAEGARQLMGTTAWPRQSRLGEAAAAQARPQATRAELRAQRDSPVSCLANHVTMRPQPKLLVG
jgi:hypothetical protein